MRKKWIAAAAAVLVVAITGFLYIQSRPSQNPQPSMQQNMNAIRFEVTREDLSSTVEVKGKSSYKKETYINAPFGADVTEWSVAEGQQVRKGEPLFRLDDTALRNEIAELQAAIKKKEADLKLSEFQEATGTGDAAAGGLSEDASKQHYAQSESRELQDEITRIELEHARTQLREKTDKLNNAVFAAPEDGIFLFEETKQPKSLEANERVGRIVDLTQLELIAYVGEYDLFRIKEGLPVEVKIDALKNVKLQGTVERLSKFAKGVGTSKEQASNSNTNNSSASAQFEVVISLEPFDQLIAGLSLTATIQTDQKTGVLVVPTLAIQRDQDQDFVMVESGGAAERRNIKIGLETPDKTEIVEGLKEGETVVLQ